MADYYVAASLVALRTEINRRWPNRDKSSDGAIGDASHAARKSDHNPDWDAGGVVRAIDVDKDGIVVNELLAAVVRDPRVAYVIWNKRIASATDDGIPWDWEPYDGENDHTHHIHISIKHTRAAETNTAKWFKAAPPKEIDVTKEEVDKVVQAYALWSRVNELDVEIAVAVAKKDTVRADILAKHRAPLEAKRLQLTGGGK